MKAAALRNKTAVAYLPNRGVALLINEIFRQVCRWSER